METNGTQMQHAEYLGFHHVTFWVGNAKQAASYYCNQMGFEPLAYRGLETGDRIIAGHVIHCNQVILEFQTALTGENQVMAEHQRVHGDGVKDISFNVEGIEQLVKMVDSTGGRIVKPVHNVSDDNGTVKIAIIHAYGHTTHTLIENVNYKGKFLPGYQETPLKLNNLQNLPETGLVVIDHCVGNQPEDQMESVAAYYEKVLRFHRFWSVDDKQIHTEYSSLRSIVMSSDNEQIKLPINEPASGKRKSQIQEFVDFYGGAGVQHIALRTNDIIKAIKALRARGVQFLETPATYYKQLKDRLSRSSIKVLEDLEVLQHLHILVDFDEKGYLLQIFTKPMQDRPTLFFEVIQRRDHNGFGAGNFKALFEAIENEQALRGNLY